MIEETGFSRSVHQQKKKKKFSVELLNIIILNISTSLRKGETRHKSLKIS